MNTTSITSVTHPIITVGTMGDKKGPSRGKSSLGFVSHGKAAFTNWAADDVDEIIAVKRYGGPLNKSK